MNEDSLHHHGISPFRRLRLLVRAETRDLWVAVVYSAAIGLMTLVVPIATQSLVNTVAFGTLLQPLVVLTLLVFLGLCFATLLQGFRTWIVEIIQRRFFVRVAGDVAHRVLRARPEAFDGGHGPEVVNRFLEVVTVQKSAAMLLIDGLSILMQTVIGMVLLAVYHPWLLAFDVLLLASIAIVLFPMGSGAVASSIQESKAKYELMAWLEELARHPLTFKSVNGTSLALATTNTLTSHWLKYRSRHFRILLRQIVGSFVLQAAASSVLLGVGGWLVIQRQLTLGQLIAAEIVVALVVSGFTKFGKTLEVFYDMLAAVDKLGYLTDLPLENDGVEPLPASHSGIAVSLRNVGLGYTHNPRVLEGLTWEIPAGSRVGLRGNSGGGKSTLVNMLYGLRSPETGVVELDGVDLRDIRLNDVRSQVSLVRENEIFQGSIAANVKMGREEMTLGDVRDALNRVGLLAQVQALPEGLNTLLATGGNPLSGGQAARLMLARAISSRPRLLILDESLDRIDDVTDRRRVLEMLFDRSAPWTLIVVSHSDDILAFCDRVVELRAGMVETAA